MNLLATRTLALIAILFAALASCSKEDKAISVEGSDPEMKAAIAKARSTLPQFWQTYENPGPGEANFALKVSITDKHGTEHFWATDVDRKDGKIMGTINNVPNIVANVKNGDRIAIPEASISDWLYMRDQKMVGNETLKPLFKQMSADEVAKLKSMMANP